MKIYLAGPFFNDEEIKQNMIAENIPVSKGLEVFAPRNHFIENAEELEHSLWASKVFDMDIQAIQECDAVVQLYSGLYSDSGTAFECGYAFANNKPVITVYVNNEISSLMVTNGTHANLVGFEELQKYNFDLLTQKNYPYEQK